MDLGLTIKEIRQEKKYTQEYLAHLCGMTQTYLSQIERNQKEPTISALKDIAAALEMPLPVLFFLSLDDRDVAVEKRDAFKTIGGSLKSVIHEFFSL